MKRLFIILFFSFGLTSFVSDYSLTNDVKSFKFRSLDQTSFKDGERLDYTIHYGLIDAGFASMELKSDGVKVNDRDVYHCVGTGRSLGAFDWFFKVRDKYETYIDKEGIFPHVFKRDVNEGGYTINQEYKFYQNKRVIDNGVDNVSDVPSYCQDMLSSFYYARTLDYSGAVKGDIFTIYSYVDEKVYPIKIKYKGIKNISIRSGKYKCFLFNPVVQTGRIFKHESDCNFYITCDKNKIPLLIEAKLMVGSIKMEITGYKGLMEKLDKLD